MTRLSYRIGEVFCHVNDFLRLSADYDFVKPSFGRYNNLIQRHRGLRGRQVGLAGLNGVTHDRGEMPESIASGR